MVAGAVGCALFSALAPSGCVFEGCRGHARCVPTDAITVCGNARFLSSLAMCWGPIGALLPPSLAAFALTPLNRWGDRRAQQARYEQDAELRHLGSATDLRRRGRAAARGGRDGCHRLDLELSLSLRVNQQQAASRFTPSLCRQCHQDGHGNQQRIEYSMGEARDDPRPPATGRGRYTRGTRGYARAAYPYYSSK